MILIKVLINSRDTRLWYLINLKIEKSINTKNVILKHVKMNQFFSTKGSKNTKQMKMIKPKKFSSKKLNSMNY